MQTFLPVNSVCIGYHTTSRSIFNLFARVCFSKKYQTGKNTPEQNSSTKHPHNGIRSTQHLNQVSRATSKWPMKICGTWLVVKQFYCFFLPITVVHFLRIELYFLVFALCLLIGCSQSPIFCKFIEFDRFTLRAATIYLGFVSNLLSRLPPPA